ncbi:unnamed protein product [Spodoptera littoralis]|uniref:Enoyl-[acyl-carrier-protein] reductase, mitochondrial n=1 Tax=Spodoptera littoralis TaxID=7109 RepID=A0A9P0I584_SPOLI|nr:unnamed protein product [Spodoptera littoralis]
MIANIHSKFSLKHTLKGSVRYLTSKQLVFSEFGNPSKVLKLEEYKLPDLGPNDVLVRMLAAPVNPADINTIQGKYPVKLKLPCIPGNEGVGIVEKIGSEVKKFCLGNKVILTMPAQGTWRNLAIFSSSALTAVPDALRVPEAATLAVNPCTSFRLLNDFIPVRGTNLVVIQNGANSSCGQNIIQLCKTWGIQTINIVRNRPEINDLKKYLITLGATHVLTEEEAKRTPIFKNKEIEKPSLGLNCVGGQSSSLIAKHLKHSGCMVTYGGMSRNPVTIPTSAFIFKNLTFQGFWMTAWNKKASNLSAKDEMLSEIIVLMLKDKLKAPTHQMIKFDNYLEAISNTLTSKGFRGHKYILDFR